MPIGLKHFLLAYSFVWILLAGYLLSLAFRQRRLSEELRSLKERVVGKQAD